MATQTKLTVSRGAHYKSDVAVAAGTATAAGDTLELNVDQSAMTKGECLILLGKLHDAIFAAPWPLR